jgi:hypothetical protein
MALSHEWAEWHLTRSGWVRGDEKMDFTAVTVRPVPSGRVLTVRFTERVSCMRAKPDRCLCTVWQDNTRYEQMEKLLLKHGPCPRSL